MKQVENKLLQTLLALAFLLFAEVAVSASISGHAFDESGNALTKVSVCLARAGAPEVCEKVRWTDKKGGYNFSGLKVGIDYLITVNGDNSASNRKFEQHANYAWQPRKHTVSLNSKNEKRSVEDFVGKFNFSNFQRIVSLTAADFPELSSIDSIGSYVGLKVFINTGTLDEPPMTIFLGRVHEADKLNIQASVPLSVSLIEYEIFSSSLAIAGSITLVQP